MNPPPTLPSTCSQKKYGAKYPKASEWLTNDRDELLTLYDFPADPRTATQSRRRLAPCGCDTPEHGFASREACAAMVHKLAEPARRRSATTRRSAAPQKNHEAPAAKDSQGRMVCGSSANHDRRCAQ